MLFYLPKAWREIQSCKDYGKGGFASGECLDVASCVSCAIVCLVPVGNCESASTSSFSMVLLAVENIGDGGNRCFIWCVNRKKDGFVYLYSFLT